VAGGSEGGNNEAVIFTEAMDVFNGAPDPGFETRGIVMVSGLPRAGKGTGDEQAQAT